MRAAKWSKAGRRVMSAKQSGVIYCRSELLVAPESISALINRYSY